MSVKNLPQPLSKFSDVKNGPDGVKFLSPTSALETRGRACTGWTEWEGRWGTQQARCNTLVLVPADMPVSHPQANRCRPWGGAVWARLEQRVRLCCSLQPRVAGRVQERLETIPARISAPSGFWCTGCLSGKQTLPEKLDPTFWIGHLWRGKQALGQGAKALRRRRTRV